MPSPTRRELLMLALAGSSASAFSRSEAEDIAQRLAAHYPVNASLGYVTALIWQAQRLLSPASQPGWLRLQQAALAAPLPADWPQRAGYAAFAMGDAAAQALARQAVMTAIADTPAGARLVGLRPWTDDLFMPALLVGSVHPLLAPTEQARATEALGHSLLALAERLQRPDGLFHHADGAPVAWGRGNGFASLGLVLALSGPVPADSPTGRQLLRRLQAHLTALIDLQGTDRLWRQVLDHDVAPGELTVTAMSLTALARARERGWLRAGVPDAAIARAWAAVRERVDAQGGFSSVCASTPAGPTLDFYLQRPMLSGRDDRAAALVLHAALALRPTPASR